MNISNGDILTKGILIIVLGFIIITMMQPESHNSGVLSNNTNSYKSTNVNTNSADNSNKNVKNNTNDVKFPKKPSVTNKVEPDNTDFAVDNTPDALVGSNGEIYAKVPDGISTRSVEDRCSQPGNWASSNLLPKDSNGPNNSMFQPTELGKQNFLEAAKFIGTQGSACRNANLQLRGDPPISKNQVSPWLQSTIEPCSQNGIGIAG